MPSKKPKPPEKIDFKFREWLNDAENGGTAFIAGEVHFDIEGIYPSMDATLKIADCNRQVTLDFGLYSVDELSNLRGKLQMLRKTINEFTDKVEEAYNRWEPERRKYDLARAAEDSKENQCTDSSSNSPVSQS